MFLGNEKNRTNIMHLPTTMYKPNAGLSTKYEQISHK